MTKKKRQKGFSDKVRQAKSTNKSANMLRKVQSNPFEVKINKQKHNILGRKSKNDRGLPGLSRSKAIKKRKETLLPEYKQFNKANKFKDQRFGTNDKEISLEEKMLQRFALERKRKHEKMSQFNLNEDEELTHLGESLSTMNKFDDYMDSDDDDTGGTISGEYVEHAHFGGGIFKKKTDDDDSAPKKHKSRKDIIDEIIAKSKTAKFEKQAAKEKADELRGKLDDEWSDFQELLKSSMRTPRDREAAKESTKLDDYDTIVKQMIFDRKAGPSERVKTAKEVAAEKEALLKKQEEDRLARMQSDYGVVKLKHQSADALEDEFSSKLQEDDVGILAYPMIEDADAEDNLDDTSNTSDAEAVEEQDSEVGDQGIVDDGASLDDEDEEEENDDYSDIDSGNEDDADVLSLEEEHESQETVPPEDEPSEKETKSSSRFPSSYQEYAALVSSLHGNAAIAAADATETLRNNFAPGLGKGNKAKMLELFTYVWEHCCRMASDSTPNIAVINSLTRHLYELCAMNVESCSQCIIERLKRSYHYCFTSGKSRNPRWPNLEILIQFKLVKLFYSTSDFSHSVATRSLIFMCNILNNCHLLSCRDVVRGLFICTLVYEYVCFSKRFVPESLNFLATVVGLSLPAKRHLKAELPAVVSCHINKFNVGLLLLKGDVEVREGEKPDFIQLIQSDSDDEASDKTRYLLLLTALRLVEKFCSLYSDLPAYDETFFPLIHVCKMFTAKVNKTPAHLKNYTSNVLKMLESHCNKTRKYLTPGPRKPKPLRLFDPKIEEVGEPFDKRSRNISAAKREKDRLKHTRQREQKGAIREIRKDNKFINRQRQKEREEQDAERAAKLKRLQGLLTDQEGDVNRIKRNKYRLEID